MSRGGHRAMHVPYLAARFLAGFAALGARTGLCFALGRGGGVGGWGEGGGDDDDIVYTDTPNKYLHESRFTRYFTVLS